MKYVPMLLAVLAAGAAHCATLGLPAEPNTERSDEFVTVPIRLDAIPTESVASLQFDLQYAAKSLQFHDCTAGDTAKAAEKSIHTNLVRPGVLRVVLAGFNRNAIQPGALATVRFRPVTASPVGASVTMAGAILSDPFGSPVNVTMSPTTLVFEEKSGTLQAAMATGTATAPPPTKAFGIHPAIFVAFLSVAVAMAWSRMGLRKGHKR
jgi:hypothetical protein